MCFDQAVAPMRRRLRKLTEAMLTVTVTVTVTWHDLRLVEQGYRSKSGSDFEIT